MTSTDKIYVRLDAAETDLDPAAFVPVFHRWIRDHALPDHLAIDVADYAHVAGGPGTLLVASEADVHMSRAGGRLGMTYSRKRPVAGATSFEEAVQNVLKTALTAADLLEREPMLDGRLRFDRRDVRVGLNDRLRTPNTDAGYAGVADAVLAAAKVVFGPAATVSRVVNDPGERLELRVLAVGGTPL